MEDDYTYLTEMEVAEQLAFVGEQTYEYLIEAITDQFNNYMSNEDYTDYVGIFIERLDGSRLILSEDDSEELPVSFSAYLDDIEFGFINTLKELIFNRLTISIYALEADDINDPSVFRTIHMIYKYFILDAKSNFIESISNHVLEILDKGINDENIFLTRISEILSSMTPLLSGITAYDFLDNTSSGSLIKHMYENDIVIGNFLRKYSPALYRNEDFVATLVGEIGYKYQFRELMGKSGGI